jgi:hypothetical protein
MTERDRLVGGDPVINRGGQPRGGRRSGARRRVRAGVLTRRVPAPGPEWAAPLPSPGTTSSCRAGSPLTPRRLARSDLVTPDGGDGGRRLYPALLALTQGVGIEARPFEIMVASLE